MAQDMYRSAYMTDGPPPYHPAAMKQWANKVLSFSTQYNNSGWSANQTLGPPRVYPQHGDIQGAWATSICDSNQFIELEFEVPVRPTAISIYETYNPGAIVAVKYKSPNGNWAVIWKTNCPTTMRQSRIFSPRIPEAASMLPVNQIRIEIDCTSARDWCEIDAVELVGIREGAVAPVDDSQFIADMELLVNSKLHSDVKFEVDGKKFYAHKAILAARSSYFAKMFNKGKDDEVTLKLPKVTHSEIFCVLRFLYTNRLPADCTPMTLIKLCAVSETFEVPELKTAAMYKIVEIMTSNNVVDIYSTAQKDGKMDDIQSLCLKFMSLRLKEMSHVPAFTALPQSVIVKIVQEATADLSIG